MKPAQRLEQRAEARIAADFPLAERARVGQLLRSYQGPESARVAWDILQLSKGRLEMLSQYVETAHQDYRDILYWAEYYDHDPLLKGRDPRQAVGELLATLDAK